MHAPRGPPGPTVRHCGPRGRYGRPSTPCAPRRAQTPSTRPGTSPRPCGTVQHQVVRGRNDHRRSGRDVIANVRSFVRITGSPRIRAASHISDSRRSPCFSGCSGSPHLPPPATVCHDSAMVRVPAPRLEFGCFRIAYGGLRCLDGRIVGIGTRASQGWTIRGRVRRLSRRFPRTGPTDRSLQPAHWPGPICTGGWNGLLRTLHERIGRNAGTAGWSRSSTPRSITRTHGCSRTTLRRIASEGATSVIASQRSGTTPRGPNRGSVPQEPVSADILAPRRRHHGPSEDMAWSTMRQLADNEVGVDPADCADAIPSCRARRCISGEHDARAHSGVPFWRRSD